MDGKIIVITGCSKKSGVGYNLTHEMLRRGHTVIATVRDTASSELQENDNSPLGQLHIKALDLCQNDSIQAFIDQVLDEFKHIDVLVNNAANVAIGPVESANEQDILTTFQTKVFGPLALIRGFVPVMRQRRQGLLTTTSTIFTSLAHSMPGVGVYFAALAAFERLQESLAIELAPWNIKIMNFQPGPIATELSRFEGSRLELRKKWYQGFTEQAYQWYEENTPFQSAQDVASAYAAAIEQPNPDLCYQSNDFGREFIINNHRDPSGNHALEMFMSFFKNRAPRGKDDWQL